MVDGISFGQFYPVRSFVHQMDGRVKIVLTIAFIVFLFLATNAASLLICAISLFFFIAATRVPLKTYLKNVRAIIPVLLITAAFNLFYTDGGTVLFKIGSHISVTTNGVQTALFMAVRILLLIISSAIMTNTTSPTVLTDSIESLLSPLKWLRLDIHSLAMMMSIALRFVPTLIEETDKIMNSQKARGADLESGNLLRRIKALLPILIPLLISAFRRAAELADAMECRCYHGGDGRTRLRVMRLSWRDGVAITVFVLLLVGLILLRRM